MQKVHSSLIFVHSFIVELKAFSDWGRVLPAQLSVGNDKFFKDFEIPYPCLHLTTHICPTHVHVFNKDGTFYQNHSLIGRVPLLRTATMFRVQHLNHCTAIVFIVCLDRY